MKKEHDDPIDATWFEAGPKVSRAEGWGGVIAGALALVVAVAVAVMAFAAPAGAQEKQFAMCGPREGVNAHAASMGQQPYLEWTGRTGQSEILYWGRNGTLSIAIQNEDGQWCLVVEGLWRRVVATMPGEPT